MLERQEKCGKVKKTFTFDLRRQVIIKRSSGRYWYYAY